MRRTFATIIASGSLLLAACEDPTLPGGDPFEPSFAAGGAPFTPTGPQQPVVDVTRGFNYVIHAFGNGEVLAQTFTAVRNERLGYIELPVACGVDVLLNIKMRHGLAGPILHEVNVAGLLPPADGEFELLQVYDPATSRGIRLRRGVQYAFELAAFTTDPGITVPTCSIVPGPAGDAYGGGQAWSLTSQDPSDDWDAFPGGEDLPFITWVR